MLWLLRGLVLHNVFDLIDVILNIVSVMMIKIRQVQIKSPEDHVPSWWRLLIQMEKLNLMYDLWW